MGKTFEGVLQGKGFKFAIVVARFNEFITGKLLEGAQDAMKRTALLMPMLTLLGRPAHLRSPCR